MPTQVPAQQTLWPVTLEPATPEAATDNGAARQQRRRSSSSPGDASPSLPALQEMKARLELGLSVTDGVGGATDGIYTALARSRAEAALEEVTERLRQLGATDFHAADAPPFEPDAAAAAADVAAEGGGVELLVWEDPGPARRRDAASAHRVECAPLGAPLSTSRRLQWHILASHLPRIDRLVHGRDGAGVPCFLAPELECGGGGGRVSLTRLGADVVQLVAAGVPMEPRVLRLPAALARAGQLRGVREAALARARQLLAHGEAQVMRAAPPPVPGLRPWAGGVWGHALVRRAWAAACTAPQCRRPNARRPTHRARVGGGAGGARGLRGGAGRAPRLRGGGLGRRGGGEPGAARAAAARRGG
jgi:hypothetical protein